MVMVRNHITSLVNFLTTYIAGKAWLFISFSPIRVWARALMEALVGFVNLGNLGCLTRIPTRCWGTEGTPTVLCVYGKTFSETWVFPLAICTGKFQWNFYFWQNYLTQDFIVPQVSPPSTSAPAPIVDLPRLYYDADELMVGIKARTDADPATMVVSFQSFFLSLVGRSRQMQGWLERSGYLWVTSPHQRCYFWYWQEK